MKGDARVIGKATTQERDIKQMYSMRKSLFVLLVDDDEDEFVLLQNLIAEQRDDLWKLRLHLDWVGTYEEALAAFEKKQYDSYLIDYRLGSRNGLQLLQEAINRGVKAPIIILTGQGSYELDVAAMEAGAADYLVKGQISAQLLERSIRYAIERKQAEEALQQAHDELEIRVQERTRELAQTNIELQREVKTRQQAQEAVHRSEMRFRQLAETTSAAIFIIKDQHIRYANPAAKVVTGYDPDTLRQMDIRELAHPSYRKIIQDHGIRDPKDADKPVRYDIKILTQAGEERRVDVTIGAIDYDGGPAWVVTAFDITERDLAQQELRKAKEELEERVIERTKELGAANEQFALANRRLQAVLRALPVAVWIADERGRIIEKNEVFNSVWGRNAPNSGSVSDYSAYKGWWVENGEQLTPKDWGLAKAIQNGVTSFGEMIEIERFDGGTATILHSAAPIYDEDGHLLGGVAVAQDITAHKNAENLVRKNAARAEVLAKLSQAFAEAGLDYRTVLKTVTHNIAESLGDACVIRLISPDGKWLSAVAFHSANPDILTGLHLLAANRQSTESGWFGEVIQSGKPRLLSQMGPDEIEEVFHNKLWSGNDRHKIQCVMVAPLRAHGNIIGTLSALRFLQGSPYNTDDIVFLQELADRAAMAIENARLYESESRRAREMNALNKATGALLNTLELEDLLSQILDAAQSAIPAADKGLLHLVTPGTGKLQIRKVSGAGFSSSINDPRIRKFQFPKSKDYPARAVADKTPKLIYDTMAGPVFVENDEASALLGIRSAIVVPLLRGDEVFGTISLCSSEPNAFDEADLFLLKNFAATTTAALQNAMLHAEVQRLAITDTLTDIYNRRAFFELGQREMERFVRYERPISAIMLDIDHFKAINDTYGHAAGDRVLHSVAQHCKDNLRQMDIVARYGGDEFAILLPETDLKTARAIADRLREEISQSPHLNADGTGLISISVGVATARQDNTDLAELMELADNALMKAKQRGRNRVELTR